MGGANHFSKALPMRCQTLLDELYQEQLPKAPDSDYRLRATFLLSVAMPMVIFPMERIYKFSDGTQSGHLNDAPLDQTLADNLKAELSKSAEESQFFDRGKWAFHRHDMTVCGKLSLATGLPLEIASKLSEPEADALDTGCTAENLLKIIRNSLAHGSVMFLDEHGKSVEAGPVTKLAFVSTDMKGEKDYRFLRVGMADFREFLQRWAKWLQTSGVEEAL